MNYFSLTSIVSASKIRLGDLVPFNDKVGIVIGIVNNGYSGFDIMVLTESEIISWSPEEDLVLKFNDKE